jgi:hypothetical protein
MLTGHLRQGKSSTALNKLVLSLLFTDNGLLSEDKTVLLNWAQRDRNSAVLDKVACSEHPVSCKAIEILQCLMS